MRGAVAITSALCRCIHHARYADLRDLRTLRSEVFRSRSG